MCRINEVLLMKRGDIQLELERQSTVNAHEPIEYGCFTIRDGKTDRDPHASRTYNLHQLPKSERAAEAITYVREWFTYAKTVLHHTWNQDEYAFPGLTKVPRGAIKMRKLDECAEVSIGGFEKVGIKWATPMADNNFTQVLTTMAASSGINKSVLGDSVWFTSHCFRRGGAQYRFMFAPERRRWSLKLVKWWAGWAPNEQSETVVRYLLDDVPDREECQLGDSLAPDLIDRMHDVVQGDDRPLPRAFDTNAYLTDVKQEMLDTIREAVKGVLSIATQVPVTQQQENLIEATPNLADELDTTLLMSEFQDAKSWRDYVTQYWTNNPSVHQYRACSGATPSLLRVLAQKKLPLAS